MLKTGKKFSSDSKAEMRRQFASDNYAGICPEVSNALQEANAHHAQSYGSDSWTQKATELIQKLFDTDCEVFFVFNGTAANSLALASMCDSYQSVICHQFAHVETDECNAPGFFSPGTKMAPIPGKNGKLLPRSIEEMVKSRTDVHAPNPAAITLAQATELGTVYSVEEITAIGKLAKKLGLSFHMDGARLANAVATLKVSPRKITKDAGVDILSLGGTKAGAAFGEAVVVFRPELAEGFRHRCKQSGQLASKMRFLSAQWVGLLQDGAWLRYASHANQIAEKLEQALRKSSAGPILFPREANAVFIDLPQKVVEHLHRQGWHFYTDVGPGGARLMCSWDSTEEDVEAFVRDLGPKDGS
jgi:threonine aldolase